MIVVESAGKNDKEGKRGLATGHGSWGGAVEVLPSKEPGLEEHGRARCWSRGSNLPSRGRG